MGKILFVLLTAAIGWFLFKGFTKKMPPPQDPSAADPGKGTANTPERMVQCALCGVHMPESDSLTSEGRVSCREPARCAHRPRT